MPDRVITSWRFTNNTGQSLSVEYNSRNFSAQDNLGEQKDIENCQGCDVIRILQPGESVFSDTTTYAITVFADLSNSQINEITITVRGISRINQAKWKIPINLR
jgi:hypothetical protein